LLFISGFSPLFQKRVEISTPLNSWLKVQEGLFLKKNNLSPYDGDTFHETPLALLVSEYLVKFPPSLLFALFIASDLLTAVILVLVVKESLRSYLKTSQESSKYLEEHAELAIKEEDQYVDGVLLAYLFNPFTILSCVGQTMTVFSNLTTASAILFMLKGWRVPTGICLALATYQSLYPVSLILPAVICVYNKEGRRSEGCVCWISSSLKTVLAFAIPFAVIIFLSSELSQDWKFLDRTFGFILNVRDLKPNIGLFWYFFTEMFDHFHLLFICTFQINAFIYVIPLTIRFFNEPSMLIYSFCSLMTIFKSYPSIGDVGFYLALLPMWKHLFPFMQQKFLVGCFFVATTVLAPIQWLLWIYSGSANANFYFGVTIAFGTAQIFLLTDVMLAYLKREYYLQNGMKKELDGKVAGLSLR
jgi:phosphatidylinositol glycan class U